MPVLSLHRSLGMVKSATPAKHLSIDQRQPFSATEYDRFAGGYKSRRHGKTYVLVTLDGWNYRMCDISEIDQASEIRSSICQQMGIHNSELAQIFITELGKSDHEDALDDKNLLIQRRKNADQPGGLKFYVRAPSTSGAMPIPRAWFEFW